MLSMRALAFAAALSIPFITVTPAASFASIAQEPATSFREPLHPEQISRKGSQRLLLAIHRNDHWPLMKRDRRSLQERRRDFNRRMPEIMERTWRNLGEAAGWFAPGPGKFLKGLRGAGKARR